MSENAAGTGHADQMRKLAGIDYDDFANLMEKPDALPTTKFIAVHYWPQSPSLEEDLSGISPFGCLGLVKLRYKQRGRIGSRISSRQVRAALRSSISEIGQDDYLVGDRFRNGGSSYIDVTLLNTALFEKIKFRRLQSRTHHLDIHAQIGSNQVLLLTETLDSGVKQIEVAEQVKRKVDKTVEITNIWGLYSEHVPEGAPARLDFQGVMYFLGTFRTPSDSCNLHRSFDVDMEGTYDGETYRVHCLTKALP